MMRVYVVLGPLFSSVNVSMHYVDFFLKYENDCQFVVSHIYHIGYLKTLEINGPLSF